MKIIPLDKPSNLFAAIKISETFRTTDGGVYIKTNYLRTETAGSVNSVNLSTGKLHYFGNEHRVDKIFLRAVEMQDED